MVAEVGAVIRVSFVLGHNWICDRFIFPQAPHEIGSKKIECHQVMTRHANRKTTAATTNAAEFPAYTT